METPPANPTRKVLVVDDNEALREVLGLLAGECGFQAVPAADGQEGWQVLQREGDFALGIVDVRMPRMDGVELLRRIRAAHPTMKIVLISGVDVAEALRAARGDPNVVFLPKPFNFERLLAAAPELRPR